jgi:hypothetical protein
LIVEDERLTCKLWAIHLRSVGLGVLEAPDGFRAITSCPSPATTWASSSSRSRFCVRDQHAQVPDPVLPHPHRNLALCSRLRCLSPGSWPRSRTRSPKSSSPRAPWARRSGAGSGRILNTGPVEINSIGFGPWPEKATNIRAVRLAHTGAQSRQAGG